MARITIDCDVCGAAKQLTQGYLDWYWLCPNRRDGRHPGVIAYTTNSTVRPADEKARQTEEDEQP